MQSKYFNVRLYNSFSKERQKEILRRVNQTQVVRGNMPFTEDAWIKFPDEGKAILLETEEYFATVASLVYTKMMDKASKYRNVESRRYAVELINGWFMTGVPSGVPYALTGQERNNIRKALEKFWLV